MQTLCDEALESNSEALQVILEMLPEGVLLVGHDARPVFHNQAAQKILGAADGAVGGPAESSNTFGWYFGDKTTQLSPEELPLARLLRGEVVSDELLFVRNRHRPSGVWIRLTAKAMTDAAGRLRAGFLVLRDVTEGRLSQRTSTLLTQLVEQIADGILLTDREGCIEYVNPAFETMTGFSLDEVRGRTPRILKSGLQDAVFYQRLWGELLAGRPVQATIANRKKSGETYHVEETITPIIDETGAPSHFVAVIQDVTEALHRQEREIQLRLRDKYSRGFIGRRPSCPVLMLRQRLIRPMRPAETTSISFAGRITVFASRLAMSKDMDLARPSSWHLRVPTSTLLPRWAWKWINY